MHEPLVHDVTLSCSVDHAFYVFTQKVDLWWPKGHRRYEGSTLHHDPRVGGQLLEIAMNGDVFVLADVVACDPPHQLVLAWHPGKIAAPTKTVITFTEQGPHNAFVRVTHSEGDADLGDQWEHRAALFARGWTAVLAALDTFTRQNEV